MCEGGGRESREEVLSEDTRKEGKGGAQVGEKEGGEEGWVVVLREVSEKGGGEVCREGGEEVAQGKRVRGGGEEGGKRVGEVAGVCARLEEVELTSCRGLEG